MTVIYKLNTLFYVSCKNRKVQLTCLLITQLFDTCSFFACISCNCFSNFLSLVLSSVLLSVSYVMKGVYLQSHTPIITIGVFHCRALCEY